MTAATGTQSSQHAPSAAERSVVWRWAAAFGGAGSLAIGLQTYLLRDYLVVLQGDEASVGVGLGSWLTGIALGAALGRWLARGRPDRTASALIALLTLSGVAGVLAARVGRTLLHAAAGELIALGPSLLLSLFVFVPPGACVGAGFVALAAAAARAGAAPREAISRLYVFEALGSLAGGLLVSLVLIPALPPLQGLAVLVAASLAAILPAACRRLLAARWMLSMLCAAALVAAWPGAAQPLEQATQRARFAARVQGMELLDSTDTAYQHIDIGAGEVRTLYAAGQYAGSFPDPADDESRAHRWMLQAERPSHVLSFGGLETGALRFCLKHPVARIDLVVLDRRAFELERRYLDSVDRSALADGRVRVIFDDPRRFLATPGDAYDLILLLQPDPVTLLLARNGTVQFNRLVAKRLAPRGVYVTRFSAGPNAQAGETGILGASTYRSLRDAFGVVLTAPEPDALLVAGDSADAVTLDPERLAARWRARAIESEVFAAELLPLLFPSERVAALQTEIERASEATAASTDDRPVSLLHALTVRQQVAQSSWALALGWAARHPASLALACLVPSLLLLGLQRAVGARRGLAVAAAHATAATGGCGMAWSLILFFSFQTRVGALYSEIGALSALFMLGLAAGGARAARGKSLREAQAMALGASVLLAVALSVLGSLALWPRAAGALHALLLVGAGAATGGLFPSAANALLGRGARVAGSAGWVETADHAGAALAALIAAALLLPALGLVLTGLVLVAIQTLAMVATSQAPEGGLPFAERA
jgi:predicted membrane-bound spermidine synthase